MLLPIRTSLDLKRERRTEMIKRLTRQTSKNSQPRRQKPKREFIPKWYTLGSGPPESSKVFISSADLRELVANQLGPKLARNFGFYVADAEYYCTPLDDAREIIKKSKVDRNTWTADKFDCDDFAHVLKANFAEAAYKNGERRKAHCFGVVWGSLPGPHAINWMVNADLKLRFVEPQNDRVFFPRKSDRDIYFMLV
jgi:hypothetical protein